MNAESMNINVTDRNLRNVRPVSIGFARDNVLRSLASIQAIFLCIIAGIMIVQENRYQNAREQLQRATEAIKQSSSPNLQHAAPKTVQQWMNNNSPENRNKEPLKKLPR